MVAERLEPAELTRARWVTVSQEVRSYHTLKNLVCHAKFRARVVVDFRASSNGRTAEPYVCHRRSTRQP